MLTHFFSALLAKQFILYPKFKAGGLKVQGYMDYEVYSKVKNGKINTLRALQQDELPFAWFVCYSITGEASSAAELLRVSWRNTIERLCKLGYCPKASFRTCLSEEIYRASEKAPKGNEMFVSFPIPTLPNDFGSFAEEIKRAEAKEKRVYLLAKLGELGNEEFSELLGISLQETKEYLYYLEKNIHPQKKGKELAEHLRLSNEFRYTNGQLFEGITVPELLINTVEHDYNEIYQISVKQDGAKRKDLKEMANQTKANPQSGANRKAAQKKKKTIIISVTAAVLVVAIIVGVVIAANGNRGINSTRILTYNISSVTYGNVSTTISGSGSLSPITKETLTLADCIAKEGNEEDTGIGEMPSLDTIPTLTGVISDISVKVGDTVAAGDVLATVTFDDETTADITAPYEAVLLEFYLREGAEVSLTSNIAMFMGTDGYKMTISVDENNISAVELGQEVDITIDAVSTDEDIVGSVTDISYNGSTSGSVTAYGITVSFDYVEGTYPGMSVSAEIVIEDSGDGLLVPVDAVYTSGDTKYVYLAPFEASLGDEYDEGDIDTSKLTRVTVETGMSDGTYIIVESDELDEGDLIVITTITSTLTGSENSGSGNGGMGGFGGGGFGGGGMGGFGGDFDFGDFDPSNMPSGGFPGFN